MAGKNAVRWPIGRAKPESVGLSSKRLERIDGLMREAVEDNVVAGVITLVARRGKLAHLESFGWRDLEARKPMAFDTIFRIHSMSKIITSVATLILLEEGKIFLTEPVSKYVPEFKNLRVAPAAPSGEAPAKSRRDVNMHNLYKEGMKGGGEATVPPRREVTVHDLLTHLSGFSYEYLDRAKFSDMPLKTFVKEICTYPLRQQPGTVWHYGASTDVLGGLIEIVSGMPFDRFLEERIYKPLGMTDTAFFVPSSKVGRFVKMYTPDEQGKLVPAAFPPHRDYLKPTRFMSGGGGLVSTTCDYLRFALMLLNGGELDGVRILSRKTVELMCTDHLPPGHPPLDVNNRGFGLGVSVVRSLSELKMLGSLGEFGWGGAAGTQVWIDPGEQMVSMIMPQIRPKDGFRLLNQFRNLACQAIAD